MTQKIFWNDPYLTKLKTTVKTVEGDQVTLFQTIFYAFSGGQESDAGTLNEYSVLNAKKIDTEIIYQLPLNHTLKIGDPVTIQIDWDRRYRLMRLHFAAEIILELAYKQFPDCIKIGAHISQDKARIDFAVKQSLSKEIPGLQRDAQAIVDAQLEVISAFSDEATEQRYWEIQGFSKVPCGGTHIKNTREIGKIELKRINLGKEKERIEVRVQ